MEGLVLCVIPVSRRCHGGSTQILSSLGTSMVLYEVMAPMWWVSQQKQQALGRSWELVLVTLCSSLGAASRKKVPLCPDEQ